MKPLFIPLKRKYFEAFERGDKTVEFRPHGKRWNKTTCTPGRRVVLSLGYGKQRRLTGQVGAFGIFPVPALLPGWRDCYGDRHTEAACIHILLDPR